MNNEGDASLVTYMDERGIDLQRDRIEFEAYEPKGGSGKAGVAINTRCEASLTGLYAAGDVIGGVTRAVAPGAFTLGWHSGEMAARRAAERDPIRLDEANEQTIEARTTLCQGMLARPSGATWKEAQAALQSTMDYYVGRVRSETMLEAGLARLSRLREEARTELYATDPHELMRCLEILSLIDAGEAIGLSARARRESRFGPEHYRADFPETDPAWFHNTALKRNHGEVLVYRQPIRQIYT